MPEDRPSISWVPRGHGAFPLNPSQKIPGAQLWGVFLLRAGLRRVLGLPAKATSPVLSYLLVGLSQAGRVMCSAGSPQVLLISATHASLGLQGSCIWGFPSSPAPSRGRHLRARVVVIGGAGGVGRRLCFSGNTRNRNMCLSCKKSDQNRAP